MKVSAASATGNLLAPPLVHVSLVLAINREKSQLFERLQGGQIGTPFGSSFGPVSMVHAGEFAGGISQHFGLTLSDNFVAVGADVDRALFYVIKGVFLGVDFTALLFLLLPLSFILLLSLFLFRDDKIVFAVDVDHDGFIKL